MGKTLLGYFRNWEQDEIAQLYVHSEVPVSDICTNYYRITDKEAAVSIFSRKCGGRFGKDDIQENRLTPRTDTGILASIYRYAQRRTPFVYFMRNIIWKMSAWNSPNLKAWLDDFTPEAVFFASGDYAFLYNVALDIAQTRNIPLFTVCTDDYYLNNTNNRTVCGKLLHKRFMKSVSRTITYSSALFTICDKMAADYSKAFGKKCVVLHTPSSFENTLNVKKAPRISYLGNLMPNREESLVRIGRTLKELDLADGPKHIDVYSSENRTNVTDMLVPENGIIFHGQVGAEDVRRIIGESIAVIHTEAFDEDTKARVRYSVSAKIADSLASGTCLIVYAPGDIASVEYLKKNGAAFIISDKDDLKKQLKLILEDSERRERISANGRQLARQNHGVCSAGNVIRSVIGDYVHN